MKALHGLHCLMPEAHFLFGPDVDAYLNELSKHGVALRKWKVMYRDHMQTAPPGYDHKKVVDGTFAESEWFAQQHDDAPRRFEGYLRLSD